MSGFRIAALRLLCPDPAATASFYEAAFGCLRESGDGPVALRLGEQRIALVATSAQAGPVAASNSTAFQHFAIIVPDMEAATARLRETSGWTAISRAGPERLPASSGGVVAFKFRDPDGHPLEFLRFPPGRLPDAWRGRAGTCLGIDHTAITVADTERSIAFYAGFGFTVASRGVNRGAEQARMDGVDAPRVEVTGLAPPGGGPPHLELLCYREPGTRPEILADGAVLATRTVLAGTGAAEVAERQDPDGHRLIFLAT